LGASRRIGAERAGRIVALDVLPGLGSRLARKVSNPNVERVWLEAPRRAAGDAG
jgi:hypothetical protein